MSRKYNVSSIVFIITVVYISFLQNLATAAKPRGFSMKIIRTDSKESPLHPRYANLTQAERFRGLVEQSKARVRHLGSVRAVAYNRSSTMNPDIVRPPVSLVTSTGLYLALVGIGTFNGQAQPFKNLYLIIDTSSDIIWTQCRGGHHYFYQDEEYYDHQGSASYHPVPCEDLDQCVGDLCDEHNHCLYRQGYLFGAQTSGELARERFTINSDNGALETVEDVIMGCGLDQTDFGPLLHVPEREAYHEWDGPLPEPGISPIAGYLGLGQGGPPGLSFAFHLDDDHKFEYCLQSYNLPGAEAAHTYLRFGADTIIGGGPEVHITPLIQDNAAPSPYHLVLRDISVGEVGGEFNEHDFDMAGGQGGTIIDTGTPFTTMRMDVYQRVRQLFVDYFQPFDIHPVGDPPAGPLDTCWVMPENFNNFPEMKFHFLDADFVIQQMSGIFIHLEDHNMICLGIVGEEDDVAPYDVILGALQQANKRIMYDINNQHLLFKDEECNLGA